MVSTGELQRVHSGLLSGVDDLAVVDDQDVTVGTALGISPADGLGELSSGVRQEELGDVSIILQVPDFMLERLRLTMSSPVTPLALPQALMT